jgi:antirestriction protein ArdC
MRADDLFATITDQLIAAIEAGAGEWRMPWHTLAEAGTPESVDGHRYRGVNALWLPMVAAANDWPSGVWATYRGWQRHGAQVRRGAKGTSVLLWKTLEPRANEEPDDEGGSRRRLVARTFTVFAAEQADGTDALIAARRDTGRDTPERIEAAEAFFAAVGADVHAGGNVACYQPATDTIRLPDLAQFDHAAHYYATAAHEHIHWTGHSTRLGRDLSGRFGSDAYAAEELVAELGSAMWSATAGISATTRHDHAAYLAHWLRILRSDARALVTVASKAQHALDYLNAAGGIAGTASELDESDAHAA